VPRVHLKGAQVHNQHHLNIQGTFRARSGNIQGPFRER
jgi:hypothetical protein